MKFEIVRKEALAYWKEYSGRSCRGFNENISETYECTWQNIASEKFGNNHISIFCSIGEWASNISDILKDESLDNLDMRIHRHRPALFRFYTRFLLITSEMLTDFQDMYQVYSGVQQKVARKFLSPSDNEIDQLFSYINSVCKHKVPKVHKCNHHLPIWFEDLSQPTHRLNQIRVGNLEFNSSKRPLIVVPQLQYVLYLILFAYSVLDDEFRKQDQNFKKFCSEYSETQILD